MILINYLEYSRRGLYCFHHKIINVHRKIKKMHLFSEGSHNLYFKLVIIIESSSIILLF